MAQATVRRRPRRRRRGRLLRAAARAHDPRRVGDPSVSPEGAISADELGVPVELRDGSRVRIRQGRRTDRQLLVRGFEHLGPESRYRRFLTPTHALGDRTVRYMTELDHHDHEAMIALDERGAEGLGDAFDDRYAR